MVAGDLIKRSAGFIVAEKIAKLRNVLIIARKILKLRAGLMLAVIHWQGALAATKKRSGIGRRRRLAVTRTEVVR